jgi:hypothetical protein
MALAVGLVLTGTSRASQEQIADWKNVIVVAQPAKPFGLVSVSVTPSLEDPAGPISMLLVGHRNKVIPIPAKAWEIVKNPKMNTLQISTERGYDAHPWLYVSIVLDRPKPDAEWDFPRVYFAIQNDKFVKRFVSRKKEGGGSVITDEWKP